MADVNLNRLAESLKLLEDAFRFIFKNRSILEKMRMMRYNLTKNKRSTFLRNIIQYRNSINDPGRPGSFDRPSLGSAGDMVTANINRAKESSRILEELFKIEIPALSRFFKSIRFQIYDVEKDFYELQKKLFDPSIYVILDEKYIVIRHVKTTVRLLVKHGVTMIQLRIKHWPDRRLMNCARLLRDSIKNDRVKFIINDRPDIALLSKADGVHLGQHDLPVKSVRRLLGDGFIIGASAHNREEAIEAELQGADYIGVGAIFRSRTKEESPVCGLKMLKTICRAVRVPVIGIGGIKSTNQRQVINCGAAGVALGEYIFSGNIRRNLDRLTHKTD